MFQLGVFLVFIPQLFWFANHEPGQTAGWGDLEFQRHAASDANSVRAEPVAATSQDSRPSRNPGRWRARTLPPWTGRPSVFEASS
jgi:hypothetical protein